MPKSTLASSSNGAIIFSTMAQSASVKIFGSNTFNSKAMREKMPKDVFKQLEDILYKQSSKKLTPELATQVAHGMKAWALERGASHYCHWFQPMTGSTAEKHDAFLVLESSGSFGEKHAIDHFSGAELLQSEPDASSFPHGGTRATFEARGYTAWDPSSPAFILEEGGAATLCIPSLFVSYHGHVLDKKTPLLRSMKALDISARGLLSDLGRVCKAPITTFLGVEQEFFLIQKKHSSKRRDLMIAGRTLVGAAPPKDQQLGDHYFGRMPLEVMEFMEHVQDEAYRLGIPVKTRHNEVAPRQYEIAPIYEQANVASDHNMLLMNIMKRQAEKLGLSVLFHEKPFAGLNGSGKHNNWSLGGADCGNLLEPGEDPQRNIEFLVFLVCVIKAVHKRADLLRVSIACLGNDSRLGGHEAPPAIMSVFLGDELNHVLDTIESGELKSREAQKFINLGLGLSLGVSRDNTDRNRTSPFAFTGNKFEFRAVPSSIACSLPNTVLNVAMAEAMDSMRQIIAEERQKYPDSLDDAVFSALRREIRNTKSIRFEGDGYAHEWVEEAARRGLNNFKTTFDSLPSLVENADLFVKYSVLSSEEVQALYNISLEQYIVGMEIEARVLVQMVDTQILPVALQYQKTLCEGLHWLSSVEAQLGVDNQVQKNHVKLLVTDVSALISEIEQLKSYLQRAEDIADPREKGAFCVSHIKTQMAKVREVADRLEQKVPHSSWPFPTYTDILNNNDVA